MVKDMTSPGDSADCTAPRVAGVSDTLPTMNMTSYHHNHPSLEA